MTMHKNPQEKLNESGNEYLLGTLRGERAGPTVIFMGGIHGNEPSGVQALELTLQELTADATALNGTIYALRGNPAALSRKQRFIDEDLNRLWTRSRMDALRKGELKPVSSEESQQVELARLINKILDEEEGPFYFFDLHTTSCQTIPFLTVNDMRMNRKFAEQYPVPMILGIEEYLEGPVLSYINELGYVAFGYEGGQHDDPHAVQNHLAFIRLTLSFTGLIRGTDLSAQHYYEYLKNAARGVHDIYEIFFRHEIGPQESFEMQPGFVNFVPVLKGTPLAEVDGEMKVADQNARLFMPLYQKQGNDGYFLIRRLRRFWLRLSDWMRRIRMDRVFALLPGIRWDSSTRDALIVNRKVARFLTREIFHLFGYRSKVIGKYQVRMKNREAAAREKDYENAPWIKGS